MDSHPTPPCVDDERSETFTHMDGWAVPHLRDVLPVAHIFAIKDFYAKKCNLEPAIGEQKKPRPVANASL